MVPTKSLAARPLTVLSSLLALGYGLALATGIAGGPRDTLEQRVKKLEEQTAGQAALLRLQDERIGELEGTVERLERWRLEVPKVAGRLLEAMARTRDQGFTRAGANMDARESLLAALESLAKDLPKVPEPPPATR